MSSVVTEEDPMLSSRNKHELGRFYDAAVKEAHGLGIEWVRRDTYPSHSEFVRECQAIYGVIKRFRAGLDASDEKQTGSPGLRRLRSSPRAEEIRQQTLRDNASAREAALRKKGRQTMLKLEDTKPADGASAATTGTEGEAAAPKKEKTMKTTAKKANARKSVKGKTTAKKTAKKAAKKATGAKRTRTTYDMAAKITWISGAENPRRKGGAAFDRLEKVRTSSGKTVESFKAKGGREATLTFAVKHKLAKVG